MSARSPTPWASRRNNLDESMMHGLDAVRRSSDNITRQSLHAIEGLSSQADLLKNVSENLLNQMSGVANRFDNQGQIHRPCRERARDRQHAHRFHAAEAPRRAFRHPAAAVGQGRSARRGHARLFADAGRLDRRHGEPGPRGHAADWRKAPPPTRKPLPRSSSACAARPTLRPRGRSRTCDRRFPASRRRSRITGSDRQPIQRHLGGPEGAGRPRRRGPADRAGAHSGRVGAPSRASRARARRTCGTPSATSCARSSSCRACPRASAAT